MKEVVLVEPDRVLARAYAHVLQQAGFKVRLAATAQDAIHAMGEESPKVIVLEVQLAEHNGVEFLYELRSYTDWQTVPVIIHSTVPPETLGLPKKDQAKLGIARYLYKPATKLNKLVATIEEVTGE